MGEDGEFVVDREVSEVEADPRSWFPKPRWVALIVVVGLAVLGIGAIAVLMDAGEQEPLDRGTARTDGLEVLEAYFEEDWARVRRDFDGRMRSGLSAERLAEGKDEIRSARGVLRSHGDPTTETVDDLQVVRIPLEFERGEMEMRITYRPDGSVAGFFVLRPGVPVP